MSSILPKKHKSEWFGEFKVTVAELLTEGDVLRVATVIGLERGKLEMLRKEAWQSLQFLNLLESTEHISRTSISALEKALKGANLSGVSKKISDIYNEYKNKNTSSVDSDGTSDESGCSLPHKKPKSVATVSSSSDESSGTNDESEAKSCRVLARDLKQLYFDPVMDNIKNCKFEELKKAMKIILKEYDIKAHGVHKITEKEDLITTLSMQLCRCESQVADYACTDAIDKHRKMLKEVVEEDQYDSTQIRIKFEAIDGEVFTEYKKRCRGVNPEKVKRNEEILRSNMKTKKKLFLQVNNARSNALCEELWFNNVISAHNECVQYLNGLELKLYQQEDIHSKFNEIKTKYMNKYDAMAKGPTKPEVRRYCIREMTHDILRMEMKAINTALTMANNMYTENIEEFIKVLPVEEDELIRKHTEIAEMAQDFFGNRLRGFNEPALTEAKKTLCTILEHPPASLTYNNTQISQTECRNIAIDVFNDTIRSLEDLIPLLNIESGNELQMRRDLKEDALKKYDNRAKGPGKVANRIICEEDIDELWKSKKKYF